MKKYLLPVFFLFPGLAFSQTASEVLRYSYLQPGGTARYLGAGGAFGALGADFGVVSQNPAGLALFRSSELIITPALKFANTTATLPDGVGYEDSKSNFHLDNAGIVFNTNPAASRWTTFNVGLGFNRQNNFHQSIFYEGEAAGSIMTDFYASAQADLSNGATTFSQFDPFGAQLALRANAIYDPDYDPNNPDDAINELVYDFAANPDARIQRAHSVATSGNMNELTLSFAGNYDEKLMLGATIGVPIVRYELNGTYEESDPADLVEYFNGLQFTEFLRTQGIGVNFKLGLIYRVHQMLRIGAAFHTPTLMGLTDNYNNTFTYDYFYNGSAVSDYAESGDGNFDYRLRTPWRASGSAAVLFRKYGFLSADVEVVDYSASRYNFTADVSSTENEREERRVNQEIRDSFRQTVNIRLGGELALDNFRLRGGFNLLGKPGAEQTGFNTAYTAGFGVRGESFFLDVGYRLSKGAGSVSAPYFDAPVAEADNTTSDLLLTVGLKF